MTMAYAGLARVFGMDVIPLILDCLTAAEAFDEGLVATSRSFAVDVQHALRSRVCRHHVHYVQLQLAERFMAAAGTRAEREVMSYALGVARVRIPAAMGKALRAEARASADPTPLEVEELSACFSRLFDFIQDLCVPLVLAAHETGYVALALKARLCISTVRGDDSDPSCLAFLAPGGPFATARNQAGAAREYCDENWPEADTPPRDWPPADWRISMVKDGLAPGGRTSAEMQRADRGGPVRNSVRFPHRLSIPDPGRGLGERHVVVGFFAAGDESAKSRRATRARRRIKKGS